jgi:hypothetical protein
LSYENHANDEFRAAGWLDDNGKFKDEMQEMMCTQVLELLAAFDSHGHSGASAPYAIELFSKLAAFEPIVPLTGEDWEWIDHGNGTYQNKRCSHVFKDKEVFDGQPYDMNGIVFFEWCTRPLDDDEPGYPGEKKFKTHYTSRDSRVPITFPYNPTRQYVERTSG